MLSCAGADRLQSGMRGSFGKPSGTAARVRPGQIILSVRSTQNKIKEVVKALNRARYKFSGKQKIFVGKKWGFSSIPVKDYVKKFNLLLNKYKNYVEKAKDYDPLTNDIGIIKIHKELSENAHILEIKDNINLILD
jgi:large subunit ribosomal protein L10e